MKRRIMVSRACNLWARMTRAETILWSELRGRKCNGYKFRRQHPIGRYITDYCCPQLKLIIEVDGEIHLQPDINDYDKVREEALRAYGYRVIRFTNEQVENNVEGVLEEIKFVMTHL